MEGLTLLFKVKCLFKTLWIVCFSFKNSERLFAATFAKKSPIIDIWQGSFDCLLKVNNKMFGLLYDLDTNTISERNQCCSAGYSMFFYQRRIQNPVKHLRWRCLNYWSIALIVDKKQVIVLRVQSISFSKQHTKGNSINKEKCVESKILLFIMGWF